MIYYQDETITIRTMVEADAVIITSEEIAQGWNANLKKYEKRLHDQHERLCISLVSDYLGNVAGYINLYFKIKHGPFKDTNYPEIVDFGVLEKYRRIGIGNKLMDVAEEIALQYSDTVCLGVGLHNGYGSAQRMYIKRGYIPDGSGVWFKNELCMPYSQCENSDDLVLYMSKKL